MSDQPNALISSLRDLKTISVLSRSCAFRAGPVSNHGTVELPCNNGGVTGRYLIVQRESDGGILSLCEVMAYESEFYVYKL